jgi:hypothetical protein
MSSDLKEVMTNPLQVKSRPIFKSVHPIEKLAFVRKGTVILSPRSPKQLNKLKGIIFGVDPATVEINLPFVPVPIS